MIEYLIVLPDREAAEDVADQLIDDGRFTSVRVVSESLAGEDDAEDVDWVVHVVVDALDDTDAESAHAISARFAALAEEHDGWLDEDGAADAEF